MMKASKYPCREHRLTHRITYRRTDFLSIVEYNNTHRLELSHGMPKWGIY